MQVGLASLAISPVVSFTLDTDNQPNRLFSAAIMDISLHDWIVLAAPAALGGLAFFLNFSALRLVDAGAVNALLSVEIVFACAAQVVGVGREVNAVAGVGVAVVVVSVVALVMEKKVDENVKMEERVKVICW